MNNKWSLRKQNTGASLLAVLITMIVVGVIGILITHLTIMNIQMKEVESSNKKNFYNAEECIDAISVELNTVAAGCMQDAYMEVLKKYYNLNRSGADLQDEFTDLYLKKLRDAFKSTDPSVGVVDIPVVGVPVGQKTRYNVDMIKNAFSSTGGTLLTADTDAEAILYVDLTENTVCLKNIKIKYNSGDYETTISTDMVFSTPKLNFHGQNLVTEYMKYALIADDKISVDASNVNVDGNVYAGVGGIDAVMGTTGGKFTGNVIVTRGDITSNGGTIVVGKDDETSRIWAENICTASGAGNITLQGNSYIADDLALNARGSSVTLKGKYYGYNFRENYPDSVSTTTINRNADFSSALMINARKGKLNISALDYLLVAGRTYISSGNLGNDVPMGESVSARANQLAYFVEPSYINTTTLQFTDAGKLAYADSIGISNFIDYLDSQQVVKYSFVDNAAGATTQYYYYLNFKSEDDANKFYLAYVNNNEEKMTEQAEEYLDSSALQLNSSMVLTLRGDLLYRDGTELKEKMATTSATDWAVDTGYWNFAKMLAINYKSLQTTLTETGSGITGTDVRFTKTVGASTVIDKTQNPLFEAIVKKSEIDSSPDIDNDGEVLFQADPTDPSSANVIFVDNDGTGDTSYLVRTNTKGVVVATGDVQVEGTFRGMILSGGTINFATGATITADSVLVSDLFRKAKEANPTDNFTKYFKDYDTLLENVIGTVEISDYLSLENWQKN